MTTKQFITEIKIDHCLCRLSLKGETPIVDYDNQTYHFLWNLVQTIPILSDAKHLHSFAQISNFYWKANHFHFIESIENYQKFYLNQVEQEKREPTDIFKYRLTDYKIFDVSVMHSPKVEHEQLAYFTYNLETGIPYRVVCPFPYHLKHAVHYQILPII